MINEKLKDKIATLNKQLTKFYQRTGDTFKTTQKLIDTHGNTRDIIDLCKHLYQMKIDEANIFKLLVDEWGDSDSYINSNHELKQSFDDLKETVYKLIVEIKDEAEIDIADLKKAYIKGTKPKIGTRSTLSKLGLR